MNITPIETRYHMGRSVTIYEGYRATVAAVASLKRKNRPVTADFTGRRFGRLLIQADLGPTGGGYRLWGCLCDCSEKVAVRSRELEFGESGAN